ncbi:MAG: transposase, partial [Symbiopectobacterium sp.]|uniref:transposase n=1 Tax=Symbiopectobacterium sp. TaxID=2952789 RepID=UPI003F320070
HYLYLVEQITALESELNQSIKADDTAQRIMTIPGVGPITASLFSSPLGDGKQFSCSRDFAASTGLVPRQYSTGGKPTLLNKHSNIVACALANKLARIAWSITTNHNEYQA